MLKISALSRNRAGSKYSMFSLRLHDLQQLDGYRNEFGDKLFSSQLAKK